ncbi:MAG: hypothetical protein JWM27_312 [Gemmatimonadetes bacterium]|nr:hypothetical protein [Gemmatimonadota bacterium]
MPDSALRSTASTAKARARVPPLTVAAGVGAALIAAAAVLPLARMPLVGRVRAWDVWPGGALVMAGLAVLAAALVRGGRLRWAWTAGMLALAAGMWTLGLVRPPVADAETAFGSGGIGVRRAVVGLLTGEIGIGWGLAALGGGALLLALASGLDAAGRPNG